MFNLIFVGLNYNDLCVHSVPFPYLVLICSGAHCILAIVNSVSSYTVLGQSLDDSPGEALDKCARSMRLYLNPDLAGLSGGAALEKLAERGNPKNISLMKTVIMSQWCVVMVTIVILVLLMFITEFIIIFVDLSQ